MFAQDPPPQAPATQQQTAGATQQDPPSLVARIAYPKGNVSFMATGSDQWSAGVDNYPMKSGDRLYCDQDSQAEIGTGSTDVRLWANTDVTLTNLTDQYEQIGLGAGSIRVRVYSINAGASVEVDTPNGSAVITKAGDYRFDVFSNNGGSDAMVNSGALQLTGPGGLNQEVAAGQAVQMTGTNPIQLSSVNLPAFDALDQWSIDRDHFVLNSQSAAYVSQDTPGYADLDSAGTWSPTPDNGPVWYPTAVSDDWKPYSVGQWAYVAPWGYTWIDAAPWGYAPFHYGRWAVIGGRWGWVPGPPAVRPVYSPALVAFVGGPSFSAGVGVGGGVAAWFPLGVGEPYTPWYHASPAYAQQVNVTNVNVTNIHNTTVVNNYNSYIANTRTVNNINQLNTNNVQYANRAQVTAVPASAMSTGRPVSQSAVRLTPAMQQQLATAPVHYAPSAPAPTQPVLPVKANVPAPTARPTLVTPHGLAQATPAANPARLAPVNLPKPQPATALSRPVPGAVAGRPATAQPQAMRNTAMVPTESTAKAPTASGNPAERTTASATKPEASLPATPEASQPRTEPRPAYEAHPTTLSTYVETPAAHPQPKPTSATSNKLKPKKSPPKTAKSQEKPK